MNDKKHIDTAHEVKDESSANFNPKDIDHLDNEEQRGLSSDQINKYREEMLTKGHDMINNRLGKT